MKPEDIIGRVEALETQRTTVREVWDLIELFVAPLHGGRFYQEQKSEHSIEWRRRELFDSTALEACQSLAASLHGSLTSPLVRWFELRFRDEDLRKDKEAAAWLEKCAERTYQALRDSDFSLEANEVYIDLAAFGTSALIEEPAAKDGEAWDGIAFSSVPIREVFFEVDHRERPIRFYRRLEWSPVQIVDKFGEENVPIEIREKAATTQGIDTKEEVIFAIYKRKDGKPWEGKLLAPKQREYGYKYIHRASKEQLGEEGGYYEMPAFLPRWRKTSGSVWGFSPAMTALGDILTLQQLVELILKATEKVVDPVILANERDVFADLDMEAGTLNVMRDINGVRPFESAARFDVSQLQRGELQGSIRRQFFVDQLELKESPAMTATEVQVRYEMMQRLLGPTLGRLQADFLDPCVIRTFNILWRAGELPDPPESLMDADSQLDIEYLGPMPRAQKQDQVASYERLVQMAMAIAQANPDSLQVVDWDQLLRDGAMLLGIPSDALVGEEQLAAMREQMAEQQAQMAEMAQGAGMASMAKDGAAAEKMQAEAASISGGNVTPMVPPGG